MSLGTEEGLDLGHIALDADPAPLPKRATAAPTFQHMSFLAELLDGSRCRFVRR